MRRVAFWKKSKKKKEAVENCFANMEERRNGREREREKQRPARTAMTNVRHLPLYPFSLAQADGERFTFVIFNIALLVAGSACVSCSIADMKVVRVSPSQFTIMRSAVS